MENKAGGDKMKNSTKSLRSLELKRNLAREELYKVMNENEYEWKFATQLVKGCEDNFVVLWEAYKTDPHYIEQKFFMCCGSLVTFIAEERKADREFKKIYRPFYDKVQKLTKEYNRLKLKPSKKQGKRK